ncbi:hypothetical protein BB561_002525 [Smittium simulii]|uniref:PH domain-containing protein n=1 Tax=Smittium simulii TaxID=133385 RepID=A0A2T9YQD3_9FUNG|nr:hypothetical protein BB561_002525 [Smittium simulii]
MSTIIQQQQASSRIDSANIPVRASLAIPQRVSKLQDNRTASLLDELKIVNAVDVKLEKEKQLKNGFLKYSKAAKNNNWKKAWCVARVNVLAFYKCEKEYSILHMIKTADIIHIELIEEDATKSSFKIISIEDTFLFKTINQTTRDLWVEALYKAIDIMSKFENSRAPSARDVKVTITKNPTYIDFDNNNPNASKKNSLAFSSSFNYPDNPKTILSSSNILPHIPDFNTVSNDNSKPNMAAQTKKISLAYSFLPSTSQFNSAAKRSLSVSKNQKSHSDDEFKPYPDDILNLRNSNFYSNARASYDPQLNSPRLVTIQLQLANEAQIKSGYLFKKCKLNRWNARWFVLRSNSLTYYKNNNEYKVSQLLTPSNINSVQLQNSLPGKSHPKANFCIKISTNKRNYWLSHQDDLCIKEWAQAIQDWIEN